MPPKRGKRKKGKSKKEVTFGPTLAERNINAVKCSLSHFMKVEKHDVVINVPGYSVGLRQEDESEDNYDSLQSGEEGEEDEDETRLASYILRIPQAMRSSMKMLFGIKTSRPSHEIIM